MNDAGELAHPLKELPNLPLIGEIDANLLNPGGFCQVCTDHLNTVRGREEHLAPQHACRPCHEDTFTLTHRRPLGSIAHVVCAAIGNEV